MTTRCTARVVREQLALRRRDRSPVDRASDALDRARPNPRSRARFEAANGRVFVAPRTPFFSDILATDRWLSLAANLSLLGANARVAAQIGSRPI